MFSRLTAVFAVSLTLLLAGCGGGSTSAKAPAADAPVLGPDGELIRYSKVGGPGLDPVNVELVIKGDHSFTIKQDNASSAPGRAEDMTVDDLQKVLKDAHFEDIKSDLSRLDTNTDQFNYDIDYNLHSVTIIHGAVPPALQPVIDACENFIAGHAGK